MHYRYLNKAQFNAELEKCLHCPTKPCMRACPVHCSPYDFIAAAKNHDMNRAAALILQQNPLGETCGLICPDKFCEKACTRKNIDYAIKIPPVQATILQYAREKNLLEQASTGQRTDKHVAVIGLGPAGIGAVATLIRYGFQVTAFEKQADVGGALNLIPQQRLPREILQFEWQSLAQSPLLSVHFKQQPHDYVKLLQDGYDAVIVAVGEQKSRALGIEGESSALDYTTYLKQPEMYRDLDHVAVIGGGAVAVDCAVSAAENGAKHVEMFVRRGISHMRITAQERDELLSHHVDITTMTRLTRIAEKGGRFAIDTVKTVFDEQGKLVDVANSTLTRDNVSLVILALGSSSAEEMIQAENIVYAGDFVTGSSTAVEAIASGQKAASLIVEKFHV